MQRAGSYLISLHSADELFNAAAIVGQARHPHQPSGGRHGGMGREETQSCRRARRTGKIKK